MESNRTHSVPIAGKITTHGLSDLQYFHDQICGEKKWAQVIRSKVRLESIDRELITHRHYAAIVDQHVDGEDRPRKCLGLQPRAHYPVSSNQFPVFDLDGGVGGADFSSTLLEFNWDFGRLNSQDVCIEVGGLPYSSTIQLLGTCSLESLVSESVLDQSMLSEGPVKTWSLALFLYFALAQV